jgi:hypothetical protein
LVRYAVLKHSTGLQGKKPKNEKELCLGLLVIFDHMETIGASGIYRTFYYLPKSPFLPENSPLHLIQSGQGARVRLRGALSLLGATHLQDNDGFPFSLAKSATVRNFSGSLNPTGAASTCKAKRDPGLPLSFCYLFWE